MSRKYEDVLTDAERAVIDDMYLKARTSMQEAWPDICPDNCDHAERLIDALTEYYLRSLVGTLTHRREKADDNVKAARALVAGAAEAAKAAADKMLAPLLASKLAAENALNDACARLRGSFPVGVPTPYRMKTGEYWPTAFLGCACTKMGRTPANFGKHSTTECIV